MTITETRYRRARALYFGGRWTANRVRQFFGMEPL